MLHSYLQANGLSEVDDITAHLPESLRLSDDGGDQDEDKDHNIPQLPEDRISDDRTAEDEETGATEGQDGRTSPGQDQDVDEESVDVTAKSEDVSPTVDDQK